MSDAEYILATTIPRGELRPQLVARVGRFLAALPLDNAYEVFVRERKRKRSDAQNRYLWGVVYPAICKRLEGWRTEDVHEYCLGEHFGWETVKGLGKSRLRPLRRSKRLNKQEFADYTAFIQQRMAEHGIYVPDPNEHIEEAA